MTPQSAEPPPAAPRGASVPALGVHVALLVIGALVLWRASSYAFLTDDGFITFRYVRNLVEGHGLVFNRDERVEGATETLWVFVLAAAWKALGWRPESAALWIGGAYTAALWGVFSWTAWGLFVDPKRPQRTRVSVGEAAVVLAAAAAFASNRSLAVWATSGLAHRQHTLLMFSAIALLWLRPSQPVALVGASVLLVLAELARPETLLMAPLVMLAWGIAAWRPRALPPRGQVLALGLPYALGVAVHFGVRYSYYGEWLPNTYYAKNVQPWWDMGARYLGLAFFEHGLWLLLPMALFGAVARSWRGDHRLWLLWLIFVPFCVQLAKGGGDHFEFRMLDLAWPLLALGFGAGLAEVRALPARVGLGLFGAWQVLAPGLIVTHVAATTGRPSPGAGAAESPAPLAEHAPAWAPLSFPFPLSYPWYDEWTAKAGVHRVATRYEVHARFAEGVLVRYARCEPADDRPRFPSNFRIPATSIGVLGYYLPDLHVLDTLGLTDHTIARTPAVVHEGSRRLAHERGPPISYFQEREVWVGPGYGVAPNLDVGHMLGSACLPACEGYICFNPEDVDAFEAAFVGFPVAYDREALADTRPTQGFEADQQVWQVRQTLADFERGRPPVGWVTEGAAFSVFPGYTPGVGQQPIGGVQGAGLLNTFKNRLGDAAIGSATSPDFTPEPGDWLGLLIGGGADPELAVELKVRGGSTLATWRGENSPALRRVVFPLDAFVGKSLFLVVQDGAKGGFGHLLLDDIVLARPTGPIPVLDLAADWVDDFDTRRTERLWTVSGAAASRQPLPGPTPGQSPITGQSGALFNSFVKRGRDGAVGRMETPARVVLVGDVLRFKVGGGRSPKLGVFLKEGDTVLASWRGEDAEALADVEVPLDEYAGRTVRVVIDDQETGGWGHLLVDDFMWTRRGAPAGP